MRRHTLRKILAPVAALAVVGSLQTSLPVTAQAAPAAPLPAESIPSNELSLSPAGQTVEVDGVTQKVIAQLPATRRGFTMAGITFADLQGTARFQVRVTTAAGQQPWQDLEYQPEAVSGDEAAARRGTEPSFVGEAIAVEARVLTSPTAPATLSGARLALIDSQAQSGDSEVSGGGLATMRVAATATTTGVAKPAIVSRAKWGADESLVRLNGADCVPANLDTTIKAAIVHHTAGTNSYTAEQSPSIVRGILSYHTKSLGWCDVGYNFLVDKYGTVFEGRHGGTDNPVHGAHATSWNTDTVGISVMMNSSTAKQSSAAMTSVSRVLAWKLAGNYRDPQAKLTLAGKYINRIARHGDVMSTSCPGTNITAYMPTLRSQVATMMGNWKTPIYTEWVSQGGESGKLGSPHILERPWNGGRTTTFTQGGVYQTSAGATFWMGAATNRRYLASDGFTKLGWPTTDQAAGAASGQTITRFAKGSIYYSPSTGARITTGAINTWLRSNGSRLTSLGYPTGEVVATSSTTGYQLFANGRLSYNGSTVTMQVKGGAQGDQNADGRADVVELNATGATGWYPTTTSAVSGAVQPGTTLTGAPFTWASQVADVNGDGAGELIARRKDGTLWAWNGQGNGRWTTARQIGNGWNSMRELTLMPDMTRDGLPEIVAISSTDGTLKRYSLNRDLKFVSTTQIGHGWGGIKQIATVGDIRKVGVVDLLAVDASGALLDYHGTTAGALSGNKVQIGYGWGSFSDVRSLGDLNGDGRWDLVGHGTTGPVYRYLNTGATTWSTRTALMAALPQQSIIG
ncbi:N-acetylmuramoyl-L-alanine amidase [Luteococcus peritonei]|uniref:N-acetylmuramoyl-L-alanine amidase n=1 Tax=Luteococcus peritonei TaxID=88874 RepID=A0ABW4RYA9_9ACTN